MELLLGLFIAALFAQGAVYVGKGAIRALAAASREVDQITNTVVCTVGGLIHRPPPPPPAPEPSPSPKTPEERYMEKTRKARSLPLDDDELSVVLDELRREYVEEVMR